MPPQMPLARPRGNWPQTQIDVCAARQRGGIACRSTWTSNGRSGNPWEDVAKAHLADVEVQDKHDVDYLKYWFNKDCGKLFCLVDAPIRGSGATASTMRPTA